MDKYKKLTLTEIRINFFILHLNLVTRQTKSAVILHYEKFSYSMLIKQFEKIKEYFFWKRGGGRRGFEHG